MALEPTQVNLQVQHFSHLIKDLALPLDRYTKPPPSGNMYSLSAQIKLLKTFEKRNECHVEEATSGESSPCQSDSEIDSRSLMPNLQDVSNVLTEELSLEVDESLEKLRDFNGKGISFVFENFDYYFRTHRLSGYIKDIKVNGCYSDKILSVRNIKEIIFAGTSSYHVEFSVRRPELLYEFVLRLQEYLRTETRRPIRIVRVLGDRRKRGQWNAVILRNLQPKVTSKELYTQCQREVVAPISVGTIVKIKDKFCCIVRCDHMEDAEAICKRLNNFLLKDPQTYEKYYFKAHLHPQSSLKHFSKEKSIFSDYLKSNEKAGPKTANKTGINDLLDMFQKSKKPSFSEKHKTQDLPKSKEHSDKTKNGPTTDTGTDLLIQSIASTENRETGEASGLSMLIKSTSSVEPAATGVEPLVKSHSHNQTLEKKTSTIEIETAPKQDIKENIQEKPLDQANKGLVITKVEKPEEKDKNKRSRSKSPYKKPFRSQFGGHDERASHNQNRKPNALDVKKHEKRTKRSKSNSKSKSSKSRSRSKSKSPSRRYKTEKSHKHRNGNEARRDSPHKSRSKDRKRHHHRRSKSKSRSKSHSKPRSHSKHHHRNKSSPGRKKPFMFEYKVNNSDSENSRSKSPSKKLKTKRHSQSRSKSKDRHNRYKNDYKTTSSYKSQYRTHRDGRSYNDHHKTSYSRRDRSGSRHRDPYNADRKDNYHYKGKDDYYERRKRDYDYDKDHRKNRRRSRSKDSRSKDKRSRSKSANSRHSRDRKRTSSTGRNGHKSTSRERKVVPRNPNTELKIEKNEGNKNEVAASH